MGRLAPLRWACVASVLLAMISCAAPDDETWMQIVSIESAGTIGDDNGNTSGSTSTIASDLQSGSTDTVDVKVQNTTVILGSSGEGVSITVYNAAVEYFVEGYSFPSFEYAVTLFLPGPQSGDAGVAASEGTLNELPLVPVSLKNWILDPANFPPEIAGRGFTGTAMITLRGRTGEGRELDVSSSVTVVFN